MARKIRIPFPEPRPGSDTKYRVAYTKPSDINVVGSYARRTAIQVQDHVAIDLAVTMPSHLFQEKDYLNYRYFHKRAFYLACIVAGIEEAEESTFPIEFALQSDNPLQPVILVSPGQGVNDFSKSKCKIRIILAADGDLFPLSKTIPTKNAVRFKKESIPQENSSTPFYNASIRSECLSLSYSKFLHAASMQSDSFADACILGSVWIRQRALWRGGFGPFEWACTMALLMQGGGHVGRPVLLRGYSSYQLFKATLQYLAAKDLVTSPVSIQSDGDEIFTSDHPTMYDGARGLNILFKMTPWSYALLRHEANRTLKMLSNPLSDSFDACFITRIHGPLSRFDSIISLPRSRPLSSKTLRLNTVTASMAYCQESYQVLKTGLGDRSLLIHLEYPSSLTWLPGSQRPVGPTQGDIKVGLLLNPEQVSRTIDRGPSAEDREAAAAFRRFWGEKAELRRFKDGSIRESLIWTNHGSSDSVLKQVITYVIRRHFGEEAANKLRFVGEYFDQMLPTPSGANPHSLVSYQPVMEALEKLEKEVRGLEGLPLQIRQMSAADPQLRYASTKIPTLHSATCKMDPANICVQLEGSSRWPDDLSAVQRTKIAILLKLGELLEEWSPGLFARIGLENANNILLDTGFLDILYPSGAFFRLRIHHERELSLLERSLKGEAHTAASREEIVSALSTYKRNFIQAPLHSQAVRTLSTRFPLLSPSMRLMKKWRDSHLLSGHICDELIELLTIRTFVHPFPWSVPGNLMTGFLRTLMLIAKWDWRSEPLILDFNGEMESQDINAINLRFGAWRKIDPSMNRVAMFVASNVDRDGITWTEYGPSKVVAARFTSLAKAAHQLVKEQDTTLKPEGLFAPSMADYDFVIHLDPKFVRIRQQAGTETQALFKNLQIQVSKHKTLVDFHPAKSYLGELRTLYGSNVLFFNNEDGGLVVAGLWNPQTGSRPWKVNLQYSTIPLSQSKHGGDDPQVVINKTATLHDIGRLGNDMVLRIEARR